jgi:voltage-gated potassium channel Kch
VLLGSVGLWEVHAERGLLHRIAAVVFEAAGLLVLERPPPNADHWALSFARVTGLLTAFFGVLYIVLGVYRETADGLRLRWFEWRGVKRRRPLVVICGLGRIGRQLAADLSGAESGTRASVVVVEADAANANLQAAREHGAVVLIGDARDAVLRRQARIHSADRVFVVCGDDSVNLDVAAEIVRDVEAGRAGRHRPLDCYANVVSSTLAKAAHDNPTFAALHEHVRFHIFNVVENSARQLVKEELGHRNAPGLDEVAHYVLFGFGTIGQAVAIQAGKLAHFENDRRLRMTIIDDWEEPAVRKSRRRFLERHPAFCPEPGSFDLARHVQDGGPDRDAWHHRAGRPGDSGWRIDAPLDPEGAPIPIEYVVNAEFLDLPSEVDAPRLTEALAARLAENQPPAVRACIIVCFDDDRRNLEAALRISSALHREGLGLPLYVYLPDEPGLETFLRRGREEGTLGEVRAFGACETSASYDRLVQPQVIEMAERFRQAYRTGREAAGEEDHAAGGLDPTFWASNQEAAHHVDIKLAAVERMRDGRRAGEPGSSRGGAGEAGASVGAGADGPFSPSDHEALARMEHHRYVAERLLAGWRYGPRDDTAKRRESLIAWRHLPDEERIKDFEQVEELAGWLEGRDG